MCQRCKSGLKVHVAVYSKGSYHISPSVQLAHIKALEKGNARHHGSRTEVKVISVARGGFPTNVDNLFLLGQLIKRIVLGCVATSAFNGTNNKNPFNFKHYSLNFLALCMDSQQVPARALKPNFSEKHPVRIHATFHRNRAVFQR